MKFHSDLVKGEWFSRFCASIQISVGANNVPAPHIPFSNLNAHNVLQNRRNREGRIKALVSSNPAREETTKHTLVGKPRCVFGIFLLFLTRVPSVWIVASRPTRYCSEDYTTSYSNIHLALARSRARTTLCSNANTVVINKWEYKTSVKSKHNY